MPHTLSEWQQYISTLTGEVLLSKAKAANSLAFIRMMESEGLSPRDAMQIIRLFAERLRADGQLLPSRYDGALCDLGALLDPIPMPDAETTLFPANDVASRVAKRHTSM